MIKSNPIKTQERIRQLGDYMQSHVLFGESDFICRHRDRCRVSHDGKSFYEGQLSHVGKHYDLVVDDSPMRIVLVGQEYGNGPSHVTLAHRSRTSIAGEKPIGPMVKLGCPEQEVYAAQPPQQDARGLS